MPDVRSPLGHFLGGLFDVETVETVENAHETRDSLLSRPVALAFAVPLYSGLGDAQISNTSSLRGIERIDETWIGW